MPILRATCPKCHAGLKSADAAGFAPGEVIDCPKCGAEFAATAAPAKPRVVEDDDRPRKKKKRRNDRDDEAGSYRTSPVRFVVLGVLVTVMLVAGYFLYRKMQREREAMRPAPTARAA